MGHGGFDAWSHAPDVPMLFHAPFRAVPASWTAAKLICPQAFIWPSQAGYSQLTGFWLQRLKKLMSGIAWQHGCPPAGCMAAKCMAAWLGWHAAGCVAADSACHVTNAS
jgi:hypothetical protein